MKLKGLNGDEIKQLLPPNRIFSGYRGSIAHGMYLKPSDPNSIDDKDLICVFMGDYEHYLGFGRRENYERMYKEWDIVGYEFRKMIRLLMKQNPNVLSALWLDERYILQTSPIWDEIIANRDLFVSKKAYHSDSRTG